MGLEDHAKLVGRAVAFDLSREETRILAKAGGKVGWRMALAFHVLYACGWLAYFGLGSGFVKAEDLDRKIEAQMAPVKRALDDLSELTRSQLIESKSSEIRQLAAKVCKAKTAEDKEPLNREIATKQSQYRRIAGEYFDIPNCRMLE